MERYGVIRYMQECGAISYHRDESGELFKLDIEDDYPLKVVKVRNATLGHDGAFDEYWLRVPSEMQTAREAVAWTFELRADEYLPVAET